LEELYLTCGYLYISDDQTRVLIKNSPNGDYINANYVNVSIIIFCSDCKFKKAKQGMNAKRFYLVLYSISFIALSLSSLEWYFNN